MTFTRNMGSLDRGLRAAVGIALIVLSLAGAIGGWGWIGVIPLVTAAAGFCPLYRLIGMKTCATETATKRP